MATVTYIRESKQSISAMKGVIDYCCQDKKVYDEISNQRLVSGINCDGENAFAEFLATKKSYKKTDGMNFYQYVQSFSPEENITPQQAHEIALEFAEKAWTGYEILVATHCDAQHIHSHFVINSVSFENGKKLRQNPNTLKSLRALSDEICRHHNLSTLEPYSNDGMKISTREYRTAVKGQSWKFKLKSISQNCQSELKKVSEQTLKEIKSVQLQMTKSIEQAGKIQEEFLNNTLQKGQGLESAIATQVKKSTLLTTLKWIAITILPSAVSTLLLNHFLV